MKILFDCTSLSHFDENSGHKAGIFYVALNLLDMFLKQGYDVTLYCDYSRFFYMKKFEKYNKLQIFQDNSLSHNILGYLSFKLSNRNKMVDKVITILNRIYSNKICKPIAKNVKKINQFDAYFSPFTPPSKDIEASNIKKIRMIHDVIPIIEQGLSNTERQWYYWYNRVYYTINDRDYYVTNSEYTRQDVLKYFPFIKEENIKTTLLGANENFKPTKALAPITGKYVFSLCTLGKRKNLKFAIESFFKFINKNNIEDLKLVLGGSIWDSYKDELENILAQYDRSKIVLTGYINEDELAKYYSNAICFIYPSLYEGFGLPVLEAMQCGCPVITSNTTSLPEVIGDAGLQITPTNVEELVIAFEKMYFDSTFREECSKRGLERAKLFSWEKCAEEIIDFIKSSL